MDREQLRNCASVLVHDFNQRIIDLNLPMNCKVQQDDDLAFSNYQFCAIHIKYLLGYFSEVNSCGVKIKFLINNQPAIFPHFGFKLVQALEISSRKSKLDVLVAYPVRSLDKVHSFWRSLELSPINVGFWSKDLRE